jgi:hypothetical protein
MQIGQLDEFEVCCMLDPEKLANRVLTTTESI